MRSWTGSAFFLLTSFHLMATSQMATSNILEPFSGAVQPGLTLSFLILMGVGLLPSSLSSRVLKQTSTISKALAAHSTGSRLWKVPHSVLCEVVGLTDPALSYNFQSWDRWQGRRWSREQNFHLGLCKLKQ